jgi:TRAP-type C4-dicarboxylate transport system substrate-binding protein
VLGLYVLPGRNIMSMGKPIGSLEELAGLKVWASAGEQSDAVQALGAVPVQSEYSQLFEYTSKGTIDAMLMSPASANGARVGEYMKRMTVFEGGLGSLVFAIFISQERWDALSQEHKDAVLRAAEGISTRVSEAFDGGEANAMANFSAMQVEDASPEFLAAVHGLVDHQIDAWLTSAKAAGLADPEAVLEAYRTRMRELAGS